MFTVYWSLSRATIIKSRLTDGNVFLIYLPLHTIKKRQRWFVQLVFHSPNLITPNLCPIWPCTRPYMTNECLHPHAFAWEIPSAHRKAAYRFWLCLGAIYKSRASVESPIWHFKLVTLLSIDTLISQKSMLPLGVTNKAMYLLSITAKIVDYTSNLLLRALQADISLL